MEIQEKAILTWEYHNNSDPERLGRTLEDYINDKCDEAHEQHIFEKYLPTAYRLTDDGRAVPIYSTLRCPPIRELMHRTICHDDVFTMKNGQVISARAFEIW